MKAAITLFFLALTGIGFSQNIKTGIVIDSVYCNKNPEQTYSLYLPSYYDSLKKWPAIYIFEPAARGTLPVNQYKSVAEELGYILVASNNSKNGPFDLAFEAGDAMFLDTFSKFSIDQKRVYTSGFSGGSRTATAIAAITGKINGVIACGAGFASNKEYQLSKDSKVIYVSLVGNKDMNYNEHLQLEVLLNEFNVTNNRIVFEAGHQWPFSRNLKEAIYWIELQCYKRGMETSKNYSPIKSYDLTKERADSTLNSGDIVLAIEIYEKLMDDYDGVLDLSELSANVKNIKESKEYKKQIKKSERINEQEKTYIKEIRDAFSELYITKLKVDKKDSLLKDMNWWKNKIDYYKRLTNKSEVYTMNMAFRLLNVIWAQAAETSFDSIDRQDYETALVLNKIWLYTEASTWAKWNMAKNLALMNDESFFDYLIDVLEESPQITRQRILRSNAFNAFLDNEQMKSVLSKLK